MFDLSFTEIALIGGVAFIIFGPEKFPVMVRKGAVYFKQLKNYIHQAQVSFQEMGKELVPDLELNKINNLKDFMGTPMNRSNKSADGTQLIKLDKDPSHYPMPQAWRTRIAIDRSKDNYSTEPFDWRKDQSANQAST